MVRNWRRYQIIRKLERTEGDDENAETGKPKPIALVIEAAFAVVSVACEDILHLTRRIFMCSATAIARGEA